MAALACRDVALYVPLVVLMVVKNLNAREMEAYVSENVVARVFIGRQDTSRAQIRDHSNIARAYAALGKDGVEEVNALILHIAQDLGFADISILSSDTTAQELPIGYPNEPSILRGVAQRCGRALAQLKTHGVWGVDAALTQVQTILRSVKEHHLFAKGKQEKRLCVDAPTHRGGPADGADALAGRAAGASVASVYYNAITTLDVHEVVKRLVPQIVQWITTGVVAQGKMLHAGLPQARAIVRNKAGKHVEFFFRFSPVSLAAGFLFGPVIRGSLDGVEMPLQALAGYRAIFGVEARPGVGALRPRGGPATARRPARAQRGQEDGPQPQRPGTGAGRGGRRGGEQERGEPSLRCIGTFRTRAPCIDGVSLAKKLKIHRYMNRRI